MLAGYKPHVLQGLNAKNTKIVLKLKSLEKTMNGLRTSFQYIQDYVNIAGLRIWQEELSRIFNFYVEQESNLYLKPKVLPWASVYQSKNITIPYLTMPEGPPTFMGRLMLDILNLTSPKTTIFVPMRQAWYDFKSQGTRAQF